MSTRLLLSALLALSLAGCAADQRFAPAPTPSTAGEAAPAVPAAQAVSSDASSAEASTAQTALLTATTVPRKIIYTAQVELSVEDLSAAGKKLLALVQRHGGYVASTRVGGSPGAPRKGEWTLRVPVERFDPFRSALEELGAVQTSNLDSQDVTEEYYDVAGHIKNKQVEEQRLQEHLRRTTGTLSDILTVEKELSRVRGEIEQLQGRLRLLANQTALTTITVTMQEVREFVPARGPSFLAEAGSTFQGSVGMMREFAKGLVLVLIALSPWAIVLALLAAPLLILGRRRGWFDFAASVPGGIKKTTSID